MINIKFKNDELNELYQACSMKNEHLWLSLADRVDVDSACQCLVLGAASYVSMPRAAKSMILRIIEQKDFSEYYNTVRELGDHFPLPRFGEVIVELLPTEQLVDYMKWLNAHKFPKHFTAIAYNLPLSFNWNKFSHKDLETAYINSKSGWYSGLIHLLENKGIRVRPGFNSNLAWTTYLSENHNLSENVPLLDGIISKHIELGYKIEQSIPLLLYKHHYYAALARVIVLFLSGGKEYTDELLWDLIPNEIKRELNVKSTDDSLTVELASSSSLASKLVEMANNEIYIEIAHTEPTSQGAQILQLRRVEPEALTDEFELLNLMNTSSTGLGRLIQNNFSE